MQNKFAPIFRIGETIGILVILNLLWSVTVILGLGLTLGAATTAAYDVMRKRSDREREVVMLHTVFSIYYKSFKENFKQSTIIWIISLIIGSMILANIKFSLVEIESVALIIKALQIVVLIQLIFINIYCYSMIATFVTDIKRIVYSSLLIANAHLFTTLTCIAISIGLLFMVKSLNFLPVFILVSSYIGVTSFIFRPIFKKYSIQN